MSYHTIHKANEGFEFTVMWLLIVAFILAVALMFVHPTGAIMLFWVGLIVLPIAIAIFKLGRMAERAAARRALRKHSCPECGAEVHQDVAHEGEWPCPKCGHVFLTSGAEREPTHAVS